MVQVPDKTALPPDTLRMPQPEAANGVAIELPEYDWDEIIKHNKPRDLWIVVGGNIYNVGEFMFHHPGGAEVFLKNHGKDATAEFLKIGHPAYAMALTASFLIGRVKSGSQPPNGVSTLEAGQASYSTQNHEVGSEWAPGASSNESDAESLREIPVAVERIKLKGERFLNFDILNDVISQLDYSQRFGHIYQAGLPDGRRVVVVSDPDLLEEIAENTEQFGKQVEGINFFTQLSVARGSGISVVSDSPTYHQIRRVMLPWYSPQHQRTQLPRMKEVAQGLLGAWDKVDLQQPLDMREWATRYALEISGRGACNYDFKLLSADAAKSEFGQAVPECLKEAVARVAEPSPDQFPWFGGDAAAKKRSDTFHHQSDVLFATGNEIVQTRINTVPTGDQTDLLSRLVTQPDPDTGEMLSADTVRDQVLMHLSNGFNGPSVTFTWIAHMLATRPDIEAKVLAEIDAVAGGDPDYDLQYADLMNLKYITQVIKEALRVYPPLPITIRNSLKDGRLGPWRMRKDDIVLIAALATHRDQRYWGPTPDEIDPDHFALEKVASRHRHAFVPFSVGVRQCMAQEVTFMMLRVGVFHIWNRYRVRLAPGAAVTTRAVVSLGPLGVQVVREMREGKDEREKHLATVRAATNIVASFVQDKPRLWDVACEIPETSPYRHVMAAYGSNFGVCRELASVVAEKSRQFGFTSEVLPLNGLVNTFDQVKPKLLVVATSTYTGNPPSNANQFKAWLQKQEPNQTWRNLKYVVWGLGNSNWNAFLAFPKFVDQRLRELGATPLHPIGTGDVSTLQWEDSFREWNHEVWPQFIQLSGAKPSKVRAEVHLAEQKQADSFREMDSESALVQSLEGKIIAPTLLTNALEIRTGVARVEVSRELHAAGSPTATRHIEVLLPPGTRYTAGDHLGVCPKNDPWLVAKVAGLLEAPLDAVFTVPPGMNIRCVPSDVVLQVRNVLTNLVDITAAPTAQLLGALADRCVIEDERETLESMRQVLSNPARDDTAFLRDQLRMGRYNIVELLDRFRGAALNFFEFLELVRPLRPRYYSTSSAPDIHGQEVAHIAVGRLIRPIPGEVDRNFYGVGSNYLHSLNEGDQLNVFIDLAEGFHIQADVSRPMIMVSAGTGFAPMRGFLFDRLARARSGHKLGEAVVINGIRRSDSDYIYRDELQMFQDEGVLDHLYVAMSREIPGTVEYVQHKIVEQAALNWELLEQGAYVFVCGSQQMRDDVRAAFVTVIEQQGGLTSESANAYMTSLESEQRYRPDVWG